MTRLHLRKETTTKFCDWWPKGCIQHGNVRGNGCMEVLKRPLLRQAPSGACGADLEGQHVKHDDEEGDDG